MMTTVLPLFNGANAVVELIRGSILVPTGSGSAVFFGISVTSISVN